MIPRLDISFPLYRQWQYWFGKEYEPHKGEYLLNHARTGIVMALRASLPDGGKVGVVAYNCHTVANAVVNAGCTPVFVDVTEELRVDIDSVPRDLDAIVVTNLFGIRNDVETIRKRCPKALIIVDNAHGYGLPAEGDFTVYSINQGKFPALGPGGLLYINQKNDKKNTESSEDTDSISTVMTPQSTHKQASGLLDDSLRLKDVVTQYSSDDSAIDTKNNYCTAIEEMYEALPKYGFIAQVKLFVQMLVKAVAYSKSCYWLVRKLKKNASPKLHQKIVMRQMAPGIRRLYKAWLPQAEKEIAAQRANAEKIRSLGYEIIIGDNGFMAIIRTNDVAAAKADFAKRGIETETHFARCIEWAMEFGYKQGSCPMAEKMTKVLLMIPTYYTIDDRGLSGIGKAE